MNTDFRFANLIGSVYRNGNVIFSPNGNSVISPVGNKITVFDLKNNLSSTVAVESNLNIQVVAVNPGGTQVFIVNEGGEGLLVNLYLSTVIYRHRFHRSVGDVKFSPNGKRLAVARGGDVQVFSLCGIHARHFNPFLLEETYRITAESVRHLDWSDDSRLLVASSEDKQLRLMAASGQLQNLFIHSLGAHKAAVIGCYFFQGSYDMVSVDKSGLANYWTCELTSEDLVEGVCNKETPESVKKMRFQKSKRQFMMDHLDDPHGVNLSACAFHAPTKLLVCAFTNGVVLLHEMPSFSLIHTLRVSELKVRALCLNSSGDWLAIGCGSGSEAQLVVWEWQSETYVMKQQSHSQSITAVAYSPDGAHIATGAEDGKVKVWSCRSSFCVVTFTEHSSGIGGVCWTADAKATLSCSLDGTVRAHDLQRYRNFRTLVCPEPTQLTSVGVDAEGDLVMAAARDVYNIFVWSLENGRLLDVLAGHSAPIAAIAVNGNWLISGSWDKTLRIWNVVEASTVETIELTDEAVDVAYSPYGDLIAVLCLDSTISLFESTGSTQIGVIDTRWDVDPGRPETDLIKKKTSEKSKTFTRICFSADGALLLAAGQSNFVCLYSVSARILVKKLKLTTNRSLDGVQLDVNRRNFSEFGNMALIDASDSEEEADGKRRVKLAGTRHSDLAERSARPEMRVNCLHFSPTGRCFAVCSTEGVSVFSLDHATMFTPFNLDVDVTPSRIRAAIAAGNFSGAIAMAIQLNENELLEEALLSTPCTHVEHIALWMPLAFVEKLLGWLASGPSADAQRHVHYWQLWLKALLTHHGRALKANRAANLTTITALQQRLADHSSLLSKMCDENIYTLEYLLAARQMKKMETS